MRLRVLTLNAWALPWRAARHTPERMRAIADALGELAVDVAALQEVWSPAARKLLIEGAAAAGLAHRWHNPGGLASGGLLVLSRLPITEARFDPFLSNGLPHPDYWGGKGFALLGLSTPDGPLALLDTHLQAQYGGDAGDLYRGHRMAQVVQIASVLAGVPVPLVAAGDFNLREDQDHYRVLVGLTRLVDVAAALERREPTALSRSPYNRRWARPDSRIDYLFARDGAGRRIRPLAVRRVLDAPLDFGGEIGAASDHAGVLADLELAPGPVPARAGADPEAVRSARDVIEAEREAASGHRRRRRGVSAAAFGTSGLACFAASPRRLGRRRLLRGLLLAGGIAALPPALGAAALAELYGPREAEAFDRALAELDALA